MKTFTIENETNNITIHATRHGAEAVPDSECFANEAGLAALAGSPAGRDLEQPARRNSGQEVQGSRNRRFTDLESDSAPRSDRWAGVRRGERGREGCATNAPRRDGVGERNDSGHPNHRASRR